jgi:hypothetical protein
VTYTLLLSFHPSSTAPPIAGEQHSSKKLALTTVTSIRFSPAWTKKMARSTIDERFNFVQAFVPDEVRTTFDVPNRPSCEAIQRLPFFPNDHGMYADTLETANDRYIYPGAAPHQTQRLRKNSHNVATILHLYLNSAYFRIKHSTTIPCQSHFVSLLRIPIPDPSHSRRTRESPSPSTVSHWRGDVHSLVVCIRRDRKRSQASSRSEESG